MTIVKKIKKSYQLLILLFYFGFSFYLQKDIIREFPHHIHSWAHTDHYALSKGFIKNGFDFFHPETLTSNKQFPSTEHPAQLSNITSSDLPIVQYSAAIIMKVIGNEEPVVYRVLMLLIASLGLLYLFKIAYYFSGNTGASLLMPIALLFSPVYLDYQAGFLPSMAAMSFLFMGVYHFIFYNENQSKKELVWTIIGLSLAAAIRTPFAILLIAMIGYQFLLLFSKKSTIKSILILSTGLIIPLAYFLYNQHLRAEYGSIFLGSPLYPRNFIELKSNFSEACHNWHYHYFGALQWSMLVFSLISLFVLRLLRQDLLKSEVKLLDLSLIYGFGIFLYMILMSRQLVHHDYYALDTFIPYLVLIAIVQISTFIKRARIPYFFAFVLLGSLVVSLKSNLSILDQRRSPEYSQPYTQMYEAYCQMSSLLIRNSIHSDEEIQIWDPFAPNMPYLLSGNSGANLFKLEHDQIENSMAWPMKYIIVRNDVFNAEIDQVFPEVYNSTELIDYDGNLLLLKKLEEPKNDQSIFEWMGLESNIPVDFVLSPVLDVPATTSEEFEKTYRDTITDQGYRLVQFSFTLRKNNTSEAFWHIHIHSDQKDLYNEYIQIPMDESKTINREIILPNDLKTWYISSYLYNPNKNVIEYSDFEVKYY